MAIQAKVIKITQEQEADFIVKVFGGEDFLKYYPELKEDGIAVLFHNGFWRIFNPQNKKIDNCNFFHPDELQYVTILKEEEIEGDFGIK